MNYEVRRISSVMTRLMKDASDAFRPFGPHPLLSTVSLLLDVQSLTLVEGNGDEEHCATAQTRNYYCSELMDTLPTSTRDKARTQRPLDTYQASKLEVTE